MTSDEIDNRLAQLLQRPDSQPDPAFVNHMILTAKLDRLFTAVRRRSVRRALTESAIAVALGGSFFSLSRLGIVEPDGIVTASAPAMAGIAMLVLWAMVTLPSPRERFA